MMFRTIILLLLIGFISTTVQAIKLEGSFTATKSCAAYKSFKRGHNPGDIHSIPGRSYELLEENKPNGHWILIQIPEISQSRRWVAKECGIITITAPITSPAFNDASSADLPDSSNACNIGNTHDSYVLALSWQSGFCEHYNYFGIKSECDNLNSGNIVVTNLTIHGLWPNKSTCGRNYGYCSDEPLALEETTISQISPWMPNFYYSTKFGHHEWKKHGTCQSLGDDEYFLLTLRLAKKFDGSAIGYYLRDNIGQNVRVNDMKNYLESELGADVIKKIELRCTGTGKRYLNEFWINLPKEINDSEGLAELVSGASDKNRFRGNCASTIHIEAPGI